MIALIGLAVFLGTVAYVVQRMPFGQRYKGPVPASISEVGSRRPPRFFKLWLGMELTWVSRRVFPIFVGLAGMKVFALFFGVDVSKIPLSTTTWVTLTAGILTLFTAGYAFVPNKRNGPLSLWMAWIYGVGAITMGVAFFGVAIVYATLEPPEIRYFPITTALSSWTANHSLQDAAGITITLVGFGLAMIAMQEGMPDIGHPSTTPKDLRIGTEPDSTSSLFQTQKNVKPKRKSNSKRKKRKRRNR